MKKLLVALALFSSMSFGVDSTSKLVGVWQGTYNSASVYKRTNLYGTTYVAVPMVTESTGGLYIMTGESKSTTGVLPESSPYWNRLSAS